MGLQVQHTRWVLKGINQNLSCGPHLHVAPPQRSVEVLHRQPPPLGVPHELRAALC